MRYQLIKHDHVCSSNCNSKGALQIHEVNTKTKISESNRIGEISDGYHTFDELYKHRMALFSVVCNQNKDIAWKSKKHSDNTMFDHMFIVGLDSPNGQITYHYDIEFWSYFDVKELMNAPQMGWTF